MTTDHHDLTTLFAAGSCADRPAASPYQALRTMIVGGDVRLKALWAFVTLGIPLILKDGPRASDDVAAVCEADRSKMRRFLYAMHAYGLVDRDPAGRYGLTAMGRVLLPGEGSMWAEVGVTMAPLWQEAGERLPETIRIGHPAILRDHAAPHALLARDRQLAPLFDMFMDGQSRAVGDALADRDYSSVRTVAVAGGGARNVLDTILRAHPHLKGILIERSRVAERAEHHRAEQEVADPVQLADADMFSDLCPPADVIILPLVLHNHDDTDSRLLLAHVGDALRKAGPLARLWCIETLLPEPGVCTSATDLDIRMMTLFADGQERTLEQYQELMQLAGLDIIATEALPADQTLMIAQPAA
ncbi:methyltransferase [Nonomuraea sp. NPDC049695]|uniref:methyltransferase n=1 Tax=Nonomuraea sp. NPDC049695 TaxID=3154734 RepID=UPI00342F6E12